MKKDSKLKNTKGKNFKINKKRAYIALVVLLAIIGFSFSIRKQAEVTITEEVSFDDNIWQEAVQETKTGEELQEIKKVYEEKPAPAPIKEEPKAIEGEEVVQAASIFEETVFEKPSGGEIIKDYSGGELVYSETMEDWRTHNGIDFLGKEGSQVLSSADGKVKKVYEDDLLGIVVEIEHQGGVVSRYCGLQSLDFIDEGKEVKKGEIIGGIGKGTVLEKEEEPHLHFEIIKDGEYENPNLYFKN